jgi:hypothetical protein
MNHLQVIKDKNDAKREKFVRLAEARTTKAIANIRSIGNLSNTSNYSYSERDVKSIRKALQKEVDALIKRFSSTDSRSLPVFKLDVDLND